MTQILTPDQIIRRIANIVVRGENIRYPAVDIFRLSRLCWMVGDMDIDCDGDSIDPKRPGLGINPDRDPSFQPHTTYRLPGGKSLNAYTVPFIVLPPLAFKNVKEKVLGCQAWATNHRTGKKEPAMIGDSGPTFKIGEGSPCLAERIGVNPNPNHGGEDDYDLITYEWEPGVPAVVDGITYALMAYPG